MIASSRSLILALLVATPLAIAAGCGSSSSGTGASGTTGTTTGGNTTSTSSSSGSTGGSGGATSTSSSSSGSTGGSGGTATTTGTGGATTTTTSSSSSSGGTCTGANDSACSNNGTNGLCLNGVCSSCNDPNDDANCKAAYPPSSICLAGVCTPGDCRTDTDCATGQICGAGQPNFCGGCTSDAQCQQDPTYGASDICDLTAGTCVSSACTTNDKKCTANKGDFCCNMVCVPGNCCVTADCTGANETCQMNQCTKCVLVSNDTYYVDPLNGDDATATGSGSTGGGCAFQTITRALQFIGPAPVANTKIAILPTAKVVAPPETFPIVVPKNVTIEGATTGTPSTVYVPASTTGFTLATTLSGLDNLVIDGGSTAGSTGVVISAGAGSSMTNLTVQNMGADGIDVTGGNLAIGTAFVSQKNGQSGLSVTGGKVTITVDLGGTAAIITKNGSFGVYVAGAGSFNTAGTLTPFVATSSANTDAGLYIFQTVGGVAAPPENNVNNFQASGSTAGNGINVFAGSQLKLRNSATPGNKVNGVYVHTYAVGTTTSDDVSKIDLGDATTAGGNTLQFATGAMPNGGVGICLDLTATAGQTLQAEGNTFEAANCATTADTLVKSPTCMGGADIGVVAAATTTNKIDVAKCM